jgi:hypothetical protein
MADNKLAKMAQFLEEYSELCQKHHFFIGSCGCCDSPFLVDLSDGNTELRHNNFENIKFVPGEATDGRQNNS